MSRTRKHKQSAPPSQTQNVPPLSFRQRCSGFCKYIVTQLRQCFKKKKRHPIVKNVAELAADHGRLESTYICTTASMVRMLAPFVTTPWPLAVTRVAWNAWTYCAFGMAYRFIPRNSKLILVGIQLTSGVFRFIDDQYTATLGVFGLLLLHSRLANNQYTERYFSTSTREKCVQRFMF